jgi:hypothetical protein
MKGIIFNLAEEVVAGAHGADAWDAILDSAELDGAFTSLGNYPDEYLDRIVAAASTLLAVAPEEVVTSIGRGAMPLLAQRYALFFAPHQSSVPFLLTLNEIIHAEVRKLYPGADVPEFEFAEIGRGAITITYRSHRGLCALAEGFILGAADVFGEQVTIDHSECLHRGDDHCTLHCAFLPVAAA